MKKKLLLLIAFLSLFVLVGCTTKKTITPSGDPIPIEDTVEPNTKVGYLHYYVPEGYKSNPDKIGLIYNDNTRKIFTDKDIDDEEVIIIDAYAVQDGRDVNVYAKEVNKNLTEDDVQFKIVKQSNLNKSGTVVYAREDYVTYVGEVRRVYYAYITDIGGYIHTVTIGGPTYKSTDVKELAYQVLLSLNK